MQATPAPGSLAESISQDCSCDARVYITTALLLLGPCEQDWVDTGQAWLCSWGSVAPAFSSHSTVPAVLAMAGGCGEGMGEEGCQGRGERPWPLSGLQGLVPETA